MFLNNNISIELQKIIDETSKKGGGKIIIPPGNYNFTTICLKSNIELYLEKGCTLNATTDIKEYEFIDYDHNEMGRNIASNIFALDESNITISGEGKINFNGSKFYKLDVPTAVSTVGPTITKEHIEEAPRVHENRVNQPVFFSNCSDVTIKNVTFIDSPCWTITFTHSQRINVNEIKILNSLVLPNCDGIHVCCSKDIIISGCFIVAGDDCVAFTAITDWNTPVENAVVSDCVFQSSSKAISVGYMHSIIRNIVINNVIVRKSNRAFVSMCSPGTGIVENVSVSNCILEGRSYGGNWWGNGEPIVLMATEHHIDSYRDPRPEIRFAKAITNFSFNNLICRGERAIAVVAENNDICDVSFNNVSMQLVPEEKPSLKGNCIDLAPGPKNFEILDDRISFIVENANVKLNDVTLMRDEVFCINGDLIETI